MNAHSLQFFRSAGLMAATEMFNRVIRMVTAIVLARTLGLAEFGLAALILTTWELVRMLSNNGLGSRIVSARPEFVGAECRVVNRLNWIVAISMFALQCLLAFPIAHGFDQPDAAPMMIVLAFTYLLNPVVMVRACLAQRIPGLRFSAISAAALASADNLLLSIFVLSGLGVWSVVLAKVVLPPFWIIAHLLWAPKPPPESGRAPEHATVLAFSIKVFFSEAMSTLRQHIDRLAIGRVLGIEALGAYAFAVNSGSGITLGLSNAVATAVLPFLARSDATNTVIDRFWTSVRFMAAGIVPVVAAQSLLATWYVPLLFGSKWASSASLLSVVCLASLSRIVVVPMTQLLRSQGLAQVELRQSIVAMAVYAIALAIGLPFGLMGAAIAIVIAGLAPLPLFLVWSLSAVGATVRTNALAGAGA